jgi:hypothetical protein
VFKAPFNQVDVSLFKAGRLIILGLRFWTALLSTNHDITYDLYQDHDEPAPGQVGLDVLFRFNLGIAKGPHAPGLVGQTLATMATGGTKKIINRKGSLKVPIACKMEARAMPLPQIIRGPRNRANGARMQKPATMTTGSVGIIPPMTCCRMGETCLAAA